MKSCDDFFNYIKTDYRADIDSSLATNFSSWRKISTEELTRLEYIKSLSQCDLLKKPEEKQNWNTDNYWDANSPIRFDEYPYSICDIYLSSESRNLFFVYVEHGGHVPERRCRLIREDLVDLNSIPPTTTPSRSA